MARACAQCGSSNVDPAAFCAACGAPLAPIPSAARGSGERPQMKTALGIPATEPAPAAAARANDPRMRTALGLPQAQPIAPPAPSPSTPSAERAGSPPLRTMLGMPAALLAPPPAEPSIDHDSAAAKARQGDLKTILGVAMPGIAPVRAPDPGAPPPSARGDVRTMLGVAIPGIAPTRAGPSSARSGAAAGRRGPAYVPPIVPAPPPLVDDEIVAERPVRAAKRGVPLAVVAGGIAALALAAGLVVAFAWKGAPPLVVQPRLGDRGQEQLHLVCADCKDGATATLGAAKASFVGKEADLDLATPLAVGDNPIAITLDRPGVGRDETVKVVVPVAYRVRADLAGISADPPVLQVNVEAVSGTTVKIDGQPVPLDSRGRGTHTIDISTDTAGPSDEGKVIEKVVPYEVLPPGGKNLEGGTVTARVGVIPLRVDAPSSRAVTLGARVFVAGRTSKGGAVTLNGASAVVAPNGSFAEAVDLKPGDNAVDVRATAPQVAPRRVRLVVKRVDSFAADAKAGEQPGDLGYDAIARDVSASAGRATVVEGDVLEARFQNHQVVAVVRDRRGCARAPCIARLVGGEDLGLRAGDVVRAFGRVTKPVTGSDGKTVPEIEVDFVTRGKLRP